MKRDDLWELLGAIPAEMIEESSIPSKRKNVIWLRRMLPLVAAALLLTTTAVAVGKHFGWQNIFGTKPEEIAEHTEPLQVQVIAEDITFSVTEALADERVLYLLWEMKASEAIFDKDSTVEGWLDFGEASVNAGGGYIFTSEAPDGKSSLLCGYLTADWNDAIKDSTAHLRVSGWAEYEDTEWEIRFDVPQTVESVTLRNDDIIKIICSPISMEITIKDAHQSMGHQWEIVTEDSVQSVTERQSMNSGMVVYTLPLNKPIKPEKVVAVRKNGIDYLHMTAKPDGNGSVLLPGSGIVQYEKKNQFGGTAFPTYERTWTFKEIFGEQYQSPVEHEGKVTWEDTKAEDFCSFTFQLDERDVNISAIRDGKVIAAKDSGYNRGLGRVIAVEHDDGTCALYGHCSSFIAEAGQKVQTGSALAISGTTGNANAGNDSLALVLIDSRDKLEYWIGTNER